MSEERKFSLICLFILSLVLAAIGYSNSLFPETFRTNKLEDEPKIMEMANERWGKGNKEYYTITSYRRDVVEDLYHIQQINPNKVLPRVMYGFSGFVLLIFLYVWIEGVFSSDIFKKYLQAKCDYWKERARAEKKTLDELLVLQRKISGE